MKTLLLASMAAAFLFSCQKKENCDMYKADRTEAMGKIEDIKTLHAGSHNGSNSHSSSHPSGLSEEEINRIKEQEQKIRNAEKMMFENCKKRFHTYDYEF